MSRPHPVYTVQVVIDCAEPHPLADWWAEALGWRVETQDADLIAAIVARGLASDADTIQHHGRLVWATGAAISHPEGLDRAPRILFVRVPEPKTTKNRVHLDLRPPGDPTGPDELDRLLAHGATRIGEGSEGPRAWAVLTDPEGNELCLPVPPGT